MNARALADGKSKLPQRLPVSLGRPEFSEGRDRNRLFGVPLISVIALGLLIAAVVMERGAAAYLVGALGLFFASLVMNFVLDLIWTRPQTVSVTTEDQGVSFTPAWTLIFPSVVSGGLILVAIARLWFVPGQWADWAFYPKALIVLMPLGGVAIISQTLLRMRRPAGLAVNERGLRGVRGGTQFDASWQSVVSARVVEYSKWRKFVFVFSDAQAAIVIDDSHVCGDAYAVVTCVNYYLHHPRERWRLRQGIDAVRHVEAEVRAGRFESA